MALFYRPCYRLLGQSDRFGSGSSNDDDNRMAFTMASCVNDGKIDTAHLLVGVVKVRTNTEVRGFSLPLLVVEGIICDGMDDGQRRRCQWMTLELDEDTSDYISTSTSLSHT